MSSKRFVPIIDSNPIPGHTQRGAVRMRTTMMTEDSPVVGDLTDNVHGPSSSVIVISDDEGSDCNNNHVDDGDDDVIEVCNLEEQGDTNMIVSPSLHTSQTTSTMNNVNANETTTIDRSTQQQAKSATTNVIASQSQSTTVHTTSTSNNNYVPPPSNTSRRDRNRASANAVVDYIMDHMVRQGPSSHASPPPSASLFVHALYAQGQNMEYSYEEMARLDDDDRRRQKRAPKQVLDKLVTTIAHEDGGQCCICLGDMKKEDHVCVLRCGHQFHDGCIRKWLTYDSLCPIDKSTVVS